MAETFSFSSLFFLPPSSPHLESPTKVRSKTAHGFSWRFFPLSLLSSPRFFLLCSTLWCPDTRLARLERFTVSRLHSFFPSPYSRPSLLMSAMDGFVQHARLFFSFLFRDGLLFQSVTRALDRTCVDGQRTSAMHLSVFLSFPPSTLTFLFPPLMDMLPNKR